MDWRRMIDWCIVIGTLSIGVAMAVFAVYAAVSGSLGVAVVYALLAPVDLAIGFDVLKDLRRDK